MSQAVFQVAFGESALVADPSWTTVSGVQQITIDRGRAYEFDQVDTGTATVEIIDTDGSYDPTNESLGIIPEMPARILLGSTPIYTGHVATWQTEPHVTENHLYHTVSLEDGLAILAATELAPNGDYGNTFLNGNITYEEDTGLDAVQTRIKKVLQEEVGIEPTLTEIFTGNVGLQETVMAPRCSALEVILDAAQGELPVGSIFFVAKDGIYTFHGRKARYVPDDPQYHIERWSVGDIGAVTGNESTVALISPPVTVSIDNGRIFTEAFATPMNINDDDIADTFVVDTDARSRFGPRTWSAEGLVTFNGEGGTTAIEETTLFADNIVDNFSVPKLRVGRITILGQDGVYSDASWDLLENIEVSDILTVNTTHPGGGGLADWEGYVEGLSYLIVPRDDQDAHVTLGIDLSPKGFYDANPFE